MNLERLTEYADAESEIQEIAQRILDVKVAREEIVSERNIYFDSIDVSQIELGWVRIHYIEDWGQSGDERDSVDVHVDDFCDPKYLLDLYEEI